MHRESSPLSWRNSKKDYKLIGAGNIRGTIESYTIVHSAPKGFEENVPYILALISLSNGEKTVSEVVDCKNVSIGMEVEPCLRRVYIDGDEGLINYGAKFRAVK